MSRCELANYQSVHKGNRIVYEVNVGDLVVADLDATVPLLTTSVRPVWTSVRATRVSVGRALAQYPPAFVHAAMMVSSELLENAIKYGDEVPGAPEILFTLTVQSERVVLRTVNGSTDRESVNDLMDRVRHVNEETDKEALYLSRLEQLLARANLNSGLGLYRIAFEGEFDLDCGYENEIVTVTATRRFP